MFLPLLAAIFVLACSYTPVDAGITEDYGTCVEKQLTLDEIREHPTHPKRRQRTSGFVAPDSFDAAVQWPNCASIRTIRNQGNCGTCWAVSSASVTADRQCIATGQQQQDFISATVLAGCVYPDKTVTQNCLVGGDKTQAFNYMVNNGAVSGGEYNSGSGCTPYSVPPGQTLDISCPNQCSNPSWPLTFPTDSQTHIVPKYWMVYDKDMSVQANIDAQVLLMQEEIMTYGPIGASLNVTDAFQRWKPTMAPLSGPSTYVASIGTCLTNHAVRLTGWGKTANGVRYWILANSWGPKAGDQGYWRIEMGKNVFGIECKIAAPQITVPNTPPNDAPPTTTEDPFAGYTGPWYES